jgi:hypothetical protein
MYSCSKCKNILSEENFCNNKARHNGKSAYCKNCDNERKKTYSKTEKGKIANKRRQRRVDKSKIKEYQKISRKKRQELVDEVKKKGCFLCGYNKTFIALDLHHLEEDFKVDTLSNMIYSSSLKKIEQELKKCIVLCANCHREVHHSEHLRNLLKIS